MKINVDYSSGSIIMFFLEKNFLKMKLTFLCLLLSFTQLLASRGFSQSTARLTLNLENVRLEEVLLKIEEQSNLYFIYNREVVDVNRKVDVSYHNMEIREILSNLFYDSGVEYEIRGSHIILKSNHTQARQKQITGRITDPGGQPLPGVTITIKGTPRGTITDPGGNYSLSNVPADAVLVFSFIGMKTEEVSVREKSVIDLVMEEETVGIEEVVAVGYGTQKKVSLTGAISSIKGTDLITTKNENVTNMLSGKISGVRIVQRTGEPGDFASSIQIRGLGAPLVVIDGVPRDNMSRLDANEIESISVLKDASAAIYGVRAANGVILITTKKGEKGKLQLEYSGYYGVQTPIRTPHGLSVAEYMEITNENNINRGSMAPGTLLYSLEEIEAYRSGMKTGTEWWRINSDYYAPQTGHNISASGSSDFMNYFVNFGYFYQEGVFKTGDLNYERFNLRSNVSARINDRLKVEVLMGAMADTKNAPFGSDNIEQYWRNVWVLKPTIPAYTNYNRQYMQETLQGFNPLATTDADIVGYERNNQKLLQATGNLIWDIPWIKGLQAKGSYSYDYSFWDDKSLQRPYYLYQYDLSTDTYQPSLHGNNTMPGTNAVTRRTRFSANTLMQLSLSYDRLFAEKHHVAGLMLYEEGTTNMDNLNATRYVLMTSIEELLGGVDANQQGWQNGAGYNSGLSPYSQSGFWKIANKALVGKFNYDFASKYFAEFSFRYDGSSKFAKGHQWGFFPSVSAGWRISEEQFLKNNSSFVFLDNLKLRASFGVSGDDRTATFQYVPGYTYPTQSFYWPVRMFGDTRAAGIVLKDAPNPNLTWMESKMYDIGLDADMWKGLLGFELDLFRRNREGLMATRVITLPDWLGEGLAQENLNKDATFGFDLTLRHRNTVKTSIGDINYGFSGNMSLTRTKIVYAERKASVDQYSNWRDNPNDRYNDIWWGFDSGGQFQNYDEIFAYPILDQQGNANMKPGDYKLEDWNGDGVVDDWDVHPIASGANSQNTPRLFYGFTIDVLFKGFDLTAVFQGGAFSTVKYSNFLSHPFYFDGNGPDFLYDRWHMEDPTADPKDPRTVWIPGTYPTISQTSPAMNVNFSTNTNTVQRADYIRCKSLELGYTLPKIAIDKIGIKNLRLYVTAYNLFTLTKLKYLDPEHPSSSNDALYPLMRTVNAGVNVKF
jgi:TonB-linked SusC/RagA family outer membrane protein